MKRLAVWLALTAGLCAGSGPDRRQAVERGLRFIYQTACDSKNFAQFGEDYIWCFYSIGSTARDPAVARMALEMGRERASAWRRDYGVLRKEMSAEQLSIFAYGAYGAERLGFPDARLKERVREAATRHPVQDYLLFDPAREPPPADVPDTCSKCSRENPRGASLCLRCGMRLTMRSHYGVWYDALLTAYFGDRYGVTFGAHYRDVLAWLPAMRPYRGREGGANSDFYDTVYSITHVVYTQDDYSMRRLSPRSLPDEFAFLKANMMEAITMNDGEMLGEFLDSLKAFGLREDDRLMRAGIDYLLATQNPDGSWGDPNDRDMYLRYHPTWTAIGGLMRYKWEAR